MAMDCARFEEILFLYTDDQLEGEVVVLYRQHMALCPECARRAEYTQRMLLVVRKRCARTAAPDRLRQRILASLPHRAPRTETR
jgi:mycothiol system anti-sigma-R factor